MKKTLACTSLILASIMLLILFSTSTNYLQLYTGVLLYIPLSYSTLKIFTRSKRSKKILLKPLENIQQENINIDNTINQNINEKLIDEKNITNKSNEIVDNSKRDFLKILGAASISLFIFSILNKKTGLLFDRVNNATKNNDGSQSNLVPTTQEDYKISEIDEKNSVTYYGFVNKEGAWYIMKEDDDNNSYRYTKGDSKFPDNWGNRQLLAYDYYSNVF